MGRVRGLNRKRWAGVRRRVLDRDGWRCVTCGKAGRLECDHKVPMFRLAEGADPYDLDNLQTLCRKCHLSKTFGELSKSKVQKGLEWDALVAGRLTEKT